MTFIRYLLRFFAAVWINSLLVVVLFFVIALAISILGGSGDPLFTALSMMWVSSAVLGVSNGLVSA